MPLPPVSFTIDGIPTPLQSWSATSVAFGGFAQMRGVIEESSARRIPSSVTQGSVVRGVTAGGSVVYEGRLSAPPAIRGGLASFAAQGEAIRAAKRTGRRCYQARDTNGWTPKDANPHVYTANPDKVEIESHGGGSLLWRHLDGVAISGLTGHGFVFWAPGNPGGLWRVAGTVLKSFSSADWKLRILRSTGPSGIQTVVSDTDLTGVTTFTVDISPAEDAVGIDVVYTGGAATMASGYVLIKDLRVNGIAFGVFGDSLDGYSVMADVGNSLGYDTTGVKPGALNVLPLDWTSGSWADLMSYIATLEDRYWRVTEDRGTGPHLEYGAWGDKEWTVYQAEGAHVDLTPLELYNQVTVKYVDVGGAPREVTVTASPDPLATTGIVNVWSEGIADVQPDSTLATAVANNLIGRISSQRYQGRIDCVRAYDATGRDAPYEIRAGDTVRVADWDMNTAVTLRIFEVEYTPNGVALGIESPVSIASLLGRAGLAAARAPSAAQLPELPPPGPPETEGPHPERVQREAEIAAAGSYERWKWLNRNR